SLARPRPGATVVPYTALFRSGASRRADQRDEGHDRGHGERQRDPPVARTALHGPDRYRDDEDLGDDAARAAPGPARPHGAGERRAADGGDEGQHDEGGRRRHRGSLARDHLDALPPRQKHEHERLERKERGGDTGGGRTDGGFGAHRVSPTGVIRRVPGYFQKPLIQTIACTTIVNGVFPTAWWGARRNVAYTSSLVRPYLSRADPRKTNPTTTL